MSKKPLEIDCIAGSQLRDTQGEMLSVEGADISELEAGRGRWNDNHGKGFFNSIGRITFAKKIFSFDDCDDDRQKYYWEKVKTPYIYARGILYDDDEHPNAKAAAAILRNIHKADCPLKLKASVEGGVLARGIRDEALLARTKIHSVALTFTPANNATLVEPTSLEKGDVDWESDFNLIKSVMHLARTDIPSFRHITRMASAKKIADNFKKANEMARDMGLKNVIPEFTPQELVKQAVEEKLYENVNKINMLIKDIDATGGPLYHIHKDGERVTHEPISLRQINNKFGGVKRLESSGHQLVPHKFNKALTAGYGGAGVPTNLTGGGVMQAEHLDMGRGFKYIRCNECGDEQIYMKHQVKCRKCGQSFPMADLYPLLAHDK